MKIFSRSILILLVLLLLPRQSFAQDWWENDMIVVQGYGFGAQARRAAVVDAYRSLAEQVKGVHITAETTIESQIISGDIIQAKVNAVIRGAEILSEEFKDDGSCVVTVSAMAQRAYYSEFLDCFQARAQKKFSRAEKFFCNQRKLHGACHRLRRF